ncbi:DNA polymerase epsilon subunit 4 [Holothuria leucospilota]|uniref:DNA polymerase epsilon subunit 4 n=1 Tax=Holothuria leucospilota TaxID=206669 RepID=A0A9Q1C5N5_HOLLE|nr:DNA polymerase epsilon subunit 4 [Holothuria leucospilota]
MAANMSRESQEEGETQIMAEKDQTAAKNEKSSKFPLSRIKVIMKTDPDMTLASQESVFLIAKAVELFLDDLTKSAYEYTARNKKKTLKKQDIVVHVVTALCSNVSLFQSLYIQASLMKISVWSQEMRLHS